MEEILIAKDFPTIKPDNFSEVKLSPLQKEELKDIGLSLKQLENRYQAALRRTSRRFSTYIPKRYSFIRALIYAIKKEASRTGIKPQKVFITYDIHSTNRRDYRQFQLLPKGLHHQLHNENKLRLCQYCNEFKKPEDMAREKNTKDGISKSICKYCRSMIEREHRILREAS